MKSKKTPLEEKILPQRKIFPIIMPKIMQFRSKTSFQTLKTIPSGSENRATGLLTQAGYIRQEMAGVYNYLPLGLKVLRKIE